MDLGEGRFLKKIMKLNHVLPGAVFPEVIKIDQHLQGQFFQCLLKVVLGISHKKSEEFCPFYITLCLCFQESLVAFVQLLLVAKFNGSLKPLLEFFLPLLLNPFRQSTNWGLGCLTAESGVILQGFALDFLTHLEPTHEAIG